MAARKLSNSLRTLLGDKEAAQKPASVLFARLDEQHSAGKEQRSSEAGRAEGRLESRDEPRAEPEQHPCPQGSPRGRQRMVEAPAM